MLNIINFFVFLITLIVKFYFEQQNRLKILHKFGFYEFIKI